MSFFKKRRIPPELRQSWEPADQTAQYNTKLTPEQEAQFSQQYAPGDSFDYDMRGAFAANTKAAANGHYPDTYKKPNHATFSTGSQYSTPDQQGGQWVDTGIPNPEQPGQTKWVFYASPYNMNNLGAGGLTNYFNQREQGNIPVLPIHYSLPRNR